MQKEQIILNLEKLGKLFSAIAENEGSLQDESMKPHFVSGVELIDRLRHENSWFTRTSVEFALKSWSSALQKVKLEKWLSNYNLTTPSKKVGVIMAGNIPLVGLHDAISVLVAGHQLHAKLSSKDKTLMGFVLQVLASQSEAWKNQIVVGDRLNDIEMLIATGSDNSARYFEYYFKDIKKIIRKNRTSVAILNGNESQEELDGLADDIFIHFGLGCRNITKVYLPESYDKDLLFGAFFKYKEYAEHNAYANNYDYNKAVYLLNNIDLVENGFLLLKEDQGIHSPVGVLFYEYYTDLKDLKNQLDQHKEEIQARVGHDFEVPFGKSQSPQLWDYADGVDTMEFLTNS
tara:strand:- start:2828 stop:3865 length:1038 start_codon:yes stop_codon:yes gene_type:complete